MALTFPDETPVPRQAFPVLEFDRGAYRSAYRARSDHPRSPCPNAPSVESGCDAFPVSSLMRSIRNDRIQWQDAVIPDGGIKVVPATSRNRGRVRSG